METVCCSKTLITAVHHVTAHKIIVWKFTRDLSWCTYNLIPCSLNQIKFCFAAACLLWHPLSFSEAFSQMSEAANSCQLSASLAKFLIRLIGFHRCGTCTMIILSAFWGPVSIHHTHAYWQNIALKEVFRTSWRMSSSNLTGCSDTAWCMTLWRFVEGWHYIWGSHSADWCDYSPLGSEAVIASTKIYMSWVRHTEHR